jgi:hypothetical protein
LLGEDQHEGDGRGTVFFVALITKHFFQQAQSTWALTELIVTNGCIVKAIGEFRYAASYALPLWISSARSSPSQA